VVYHFQNLLLLSSQFHSISNSSLLQPSTSRNTPLIPITCLTPLPSHSTHFSLHLLPNPLSSHPLPSHPVSFSLRPFSFLDPITSLQHTWVGKSRGWKEYSQGDRQVGTGRGWGKEWRGMRMTEGQSGERIREEGEEGGGVRNREMWVGEGKRSMMGYRMHVAGAQVWEGRWEGKGNRGKDRPSSLQFTVLGRAPLLF